MLSSRLDMEAVAHILLVKCYKFLCFSWYALKHAIFFSFTKNILTEMQDFNRLNMDTLGNG